MKVSIHEVPEEDVDYVLVMKGAPERILERCSTIAIEGNDVPLDAKLKDAFNKVDLE